jgi:predicted RNA-binding Zn-ribbon protein involved in translation (DUF1610 family)
MGPLEFHNFFICPDCGEYVRARSCDRWLELKLCSGCWFKRWS